MLLPFAENAFWIFHFDSDPRVPIPMGWGRVADPGEVIPLAELDDIPPTHPRRLAGETVKVTVAGSVYEVDFATRTMRDNQGTVHPIKWTPPSSDPGAGGSESSRAQPLKVLGESTRQNVQPSAGLQISGS